LAQSCYFIEENTVFQTFATIELGLHQNYVDILSAKQMLNQERASELIASIPTGTIKTIELVVCTIADLGLTSDASLEAPLKSAEALGYGVCPTEVAVALCLQFPVGVSGWFTIGTEPLIDVNGNQRLFIVGKPKDQVLIRAQKRPRNGWSLYRRFIFMKV
jgi:hypothetical protein